MDDDSGRNEDPEHPDPPQLAAARPAGPSPIQRVVALLEVLLCSDYPTQAALGATFAAFGYGPFVNGRLRVGFVVGLSLLDTALLLALIFFFLHAHGESPRQLFLGRRPVLREFGLGLPLIFVATVV